MDENKIKHIEMIQGVVNRLAGNSFAYKGWAIVLVAGIFALSAKEADYRYLLVALVPTLAFWGLDAYYLRQEWLFRKLYDSVRASSTEDWQRDPFSMNTAGVANTPDAKGRRRTWWYYVWSGTIFWLYFPMTVAILFASGLAYVAQGCHGGC
jgi:hypothetical protein